MSLLNCQSQKRNHGKAHKNRTPSPQNECASQIFPPTVAATNQMPVESRTETYLQSPGAKWDVLLHQIRPNNGRSHFQVVIKYPGPARQFVGSTPPKEQLLDWVKSPDQNQAWMTSFGKEAGRIFY